MEATQDIDHDLLSRVVRAGRHPSENDAMNAALRHYLDGLERRRSFEQIVGTINYHEGYPRRDKTPPMSYDGDDDAVG